MAQNNHVVLAFAVRNIKLIYITQATFNTVRQAIFNTVRQALFNSDSNFKCGNICLTNFLIGLTCI